MVTQVNDFEVYDILEEVLRVKSEIEIHFDKLVECLRERKNILLTQLEEYKRQYTLCYFNPAKDQRAYANLKRVTEKKQDIYSSFTSKRIVFDFDMTVLDKVSRFGKISSIESSLPLVEYKGKVSPSINVGGIAGNGDGELHDGFGVAVNYRTNNIYVTDHSNHRVQVFDSEGRYLFKFGEVAGNGKMGYPDGIAIFHEIVYVIQQTYSCLFVYDSNGNYISQIGNQGSGKYQFNDPRGLAIDETNGDLFICDLNHRIQLYTNNCVYTFGDGLLDSPATIHLTRDGIFVQVVQSPFLYKFDCNLNNIPTNFPNSFSKKINFPYSSCIDSAGRIVVSDRGKERIYIFDKDGYLLHELFEGISKPMGVTIDSKGRIIVVGYNHRILIF